MTNLSLLSALSFLCLIAAVRSSTLDYQAINSCRRHAAVITEFGGKGDGKTSNTKAFVAAIKNLSEVAADGGAILVVPPGKWLTGSFNLISHFTLYIHNDAVLLGSEEESEYPLLDPLPSYGIGRDGGRRYASLIWGTNLTDVAITGGNGVIDGQGALWWRKFKNKDLENTRPYLIELLHSNGVQISNLTLVNSPSWHVHPTYCSDVIIEQITVIAPVDSPNTDGINPDSCKNTRIRDCSVVSGDDCIAVKSGWDEHGIKYGMPTEHVSIKRFHCVSPDSAVIALGSEMSGGIRDVRAEDIIAVNSESGVRIKTAPGRGAFVEDVFVRNFQMNTMKYMFWMTGAYGSHADSHWDPKAIPVVKNINYKHMVAKNVTMPGQLAGIDESPFTGICIQNVTAELAKTTSDSESSFWFWDEFDLGNKKKGDKPVWNCTDIEGVSKDVSPEACSLLPERNVECNFPADILAIDQVELKSCAVGLYRLH